MPMFRLTQAAFLLVLFCIASPILSETLVRHIQADMDSRHADLIHILVRSMEITSGTFGPFRLVPVALPMNESRQIASLENGKHLDVIWSSTSAYKEKTLRPIRIPLRQGLLGYRLLIINTRQMDKWASVQTVEDLRQLTLVQGHGWGDVDVYHQAKIPVIPLDLEIAFKAVNLGKVNALPMGINEAVLEVKRRHEDLKQIVIEPNIVLYYPWPYYFFVNNDNKQLSQRLSSGLQMLVASGELSKIVAEYHGHYIEAAELGKRRVIRLKNPLLPTTTPLEQPEYWYSPATSKR